MNTAETNAGTILLGTAYRTINPTEGMWLIGYPHPEKRANTGVGLDLCVRAAVFGSPEIETPLAAIVVLDTLAVNQKVVQRIRHAAADRIQGLKPEVIMVVATHTHSAPAFVAMQSGPDLVTAAADYVDRVVESAVEALEDAWQTRSQGSLRVGRTELRMGHNRRVLDAQGHATNEWFDVEGRHTGFFNPNARILVFENARTRKPQAVFSLYACHPVAHGPGNTKASADYPGYLIRAVEAALPGCFAIHLTGAAADINPRDGLADGPEKAKLLGEALAEVVLEEIPRARPIGAIPICVHTESVVLPLGPDAKGNYSCRAQDSLNGKTITSEIQVLRVGEVAFISAPGELFGATGLAIENTSPFATTFVAGYANDSLGYLVNYAVLREGGYEAQNAISKEFEPRLMAAWRTALEKAFA